MSHHYSGPALGFPHGDARLDLTDLYAFGKPGDDRKSILIMNVHPSFSLEPRGPTRSDPFAHEAIYELKIDTDGDSVADNPGRSAHVSTALLCTQKRWKTPKCALPVPIRLRVGKRRTPIAAFNVDSRQRLLEGRSDPNLRANLRT